MSDDLLDRLSSTDPSTEARIDRELRELGDLPARIASEHVVVPLHRRRNVRRVGIAIAAAILALGLIVPLSLLLPLGDASQPGDTGPTVPGNNASWVTVGTLDQIRAEGIVYDATTTTFVLSPDGEEPYALYAIPLEDPREATRERVLFCAGTQHFLGSHGDRYTLAGAYLTGEVDRGLPGVALRVVDGDVQIEPTNGLTPGDPTAAPVPPSPDVECLFGGEAPLEGEPGFGLPRGTELPPISVGLPQAGMTLYGSAHIVGSADVFEANVSIRILDAVNNVIAESFTTATCGTGCRGEFTADVSFEVGGEQQGVVQVFESSAMDGSMLNLVEIPVTLRPDPDGTIADSMEGEWSDPDGVPLSEGDPGEATVLSVVEGADHCGWTSVTLLHLGWPIGSPAETFDDIRQYLRDPQALLADVAAVPYEPLAMLPADAQDTGYHRGPWQLWISPGDVDQAVYVVNGETGDVERWPRATTPFGCV